MLSSPATGPLGKRLVQKLNKIRWSLTPKHKWTIETSFKVEGTDKVTAFTFTGYGVGALRYAFACGTLLGASVVALLWVLL
jgi:hypothetical protein